MAPSTKEDPSTSEAVGETPAKARHQVHPTVSTHATRDRKADTIRCKVGGKSFDVKLATEGLARIEPGEVERIAHAVLEGAGKAGCFDTVKVHEGS